MGIYPKVTFLYLKLFSPMGHTSVSQRKEMAYEYRKNRFCPTDGLRPIVRVSPMRRALQRQLQGQELFLPGSIPLHGFCTADLPGKSAGYRGVPAHGQDQALSHGDSRQGLPKHLGPRQRDPRLENLCRLRSGADSNGQRAVRSRGFRIGARPDSLRPRCHDHRSLSFGFPLGQIPQGQSRSEAPYAVGLAGQHSCGYQHHTWQNSRCQYPRRTPHRGRRRLHHGSSLRRLCRLYRIHQSQAFFVTRAKSNFVFKRLYSQPVDKSTGVRVDQTVTITGFYTLKGYPDKLRRICYLDAETNKRLVFLTNNFTLPAQVIAQLYKCRWQVELFFKWIKQHLRIKAFYGTTENAVKTQIWIAISVYVLVAIVKKRLKLDRSLYTILQILSVSL